VQDLENKINQDVLEFIGSIDKMSHSDKIELLKLLLKKYALIATSDVTLDKKDLHDIISTSKQNFTNITIPVELEGSETPVHQTEVANLCVIEATIGHLNKNSCLKKIPKFNYKKR
jgi:hypothetical protein